MSFQLYLFTRIIFVIKLNAINKYKDLHVNYDEVLLPVLRSLLLEINVDLFLFNFASII